MIQTATNARNSPQSHLHLPPLPISRGHLPATLQQDAKAQLELKNMLYTTNNKSDVYPHKTLRYHAVLEYKLSSFLVMLEDHHEGRYYIAKLLRKTDKDLWRHQTDEAKRFSSLKTMDKKLNRFAPSVNEGIYQIIPNNREGIVKLSSRLSPESALKPNREYVLLMNAIPRGESIPEVLQREAYILPDIIDALIEIHKLSLPLSDSEQWHYGKADTLRERIAGTDLSIFLQAVEIYQKSHHKSIDIDTIQQCIDVIIQNRELDRVCEDLISRGLIVDGHGNLWRENLQRGVYYHTARLKRRYQGVQCIDPDTNDLFTKQSVVNEAAMLLVDLRSQLHKLEARTAVHRYLRKMKFLEDPNARTLLAVGEAHKASVRFYMAVLADHDYDLAEKFLEISQAAYLEAAHILKHSHSLNLETAVHAGLM